MRNLTLDAIFLFRHNLGMRRDRTTEMPRLSVVAALLVLMAAGLVGGCGAPGTPAETADANVPPAPTQPPPWSLGSPENAVISYLHWISLAYRVSNSEVASQTFTPYEEVRVNSYVQYNIQEGRAIDQVLTGLQVKSVQASEGTATVAAHEEWRYRYISLKTKRYSSAEQTASYESTYTVVKGEDGAWRVDKVQALSAGPVK
ncbi:MAG TPA: hypothetical protein VF902_08540 [Coriobacteriia bacterium]